MNRGLLLAILTVSFCVQCITAQIRGDVNFMVVSDLGNFGGGDQQQVATTIGQFATTFRPTAIINLGDTFHYWGVQSTDDPGWQSNFESIYTAPALHNLWYCVLGNHDYQGNTQALIDYTERSRRWNMPARYYTKTFSNGNTSVEIIFLDTTPMLRRAVSQPEIYPDVAAQDTAAQTEWLRARLAASTADWTVVAAHHPLFSSRPDGAGQRADVSSHLGSALSSHRPDLYINGDVHCFEHIRRPGDPTEYVTCTSGSQAYEVTPGENAVFADGHAGFMSLSFDKSRLTVTMYDRDGKKLYEYSKEK